MIEERVLVVIGVVPIRALSERVQVHAVMTYDNVNTGLGSVVHVTKPVARDDVLRRCPEDQSFRSWLPFNSSDLTQLDHNSLRLAEWSTGIMCVSPV